jgi:hypothetical protein
LDGRFQLTPRASVFGQALRKYALAVAAVPVALPVRMSLDALLGDRRVPLET